MVHPLSVRRIGVRRRLANGNSVPIWLQSRLDRWDECPAAGHPMEKRARQHIHYLRTLDGVKLAWAEAGAGPVLVKASNWLSHLEYDWESPVWKHWVRFFADHFRFV